MNDFKTFSEVFTHSEGSKVITTSKKESDSFVLTLDRVDMIRYIAMVDSKTPNDVLNDIILDEFMRIILPAKNKSSNLPTPENE